jgi:hypothetical protein
VFAAVTIVALLSWGIYGILWTFPNDQGSIINAVETRENPITYCCGNGTIIPHDTEAQFIMIFQTGPLPLGTCGSCLLPNGEGWVTGPFPLTASGLAFASFEKFYAVFTYTFTAQAGPSSPLWYTGPQGNLSESLYTSHYAGLGGTSSFETAILEISIPGNYTLHYYNVGPMTAIGMVIMGPSSVVYSRPYLYPSLATIAIAGVFSIITRFALWRKLSPSHSESPPPT